MKNANSSSQRGFSTIVAIALIGFVLAALAGSSLFLAKKATPQAAFKTTPLPAESSVPTATPAGTAVVGAGIEDSTLDKDLVNLDGLLGKASESLGNADSGLKDKIGDLAE